MKTSKRLRSLIAIALISIIVASVAYALLSSTFTFQNTMSIKGVLVKLLYLADNTTVTTQAWGKLEPSQVVYFNGFALKNDGTVWAWGENTDSQLGDGNIANRMVPVKVSGLTGVTAIDTGDSQHCLAIKADGTVWAWGANGSGQVGNGIISDQFVPAQVLLP